MNVLILTPDAVGSTLLQRMLTIYMQFHEFDRPVINLHELTNGLCKYYSPEFNRELVSKKQLKNWGYHQSLEEIVELLSSVDHYKTSRVAHYHLIRRADTIQQQIPFYDYLNDNFYIIACRRSNVFEHALSMTLSTVTKKLNVYDAYEKLDTFYDLYRSGIELDPTVFVNKLEAYKSYIAWSQQYFDISSYFNYEKDIPRLEQYILNLPVFANQPRLIKWKDNFEISFDDWNKLHYLRSDLTKLPLESHCQTSLLEFNDPGIVEKYQQLAPPHLPPVQSLSDVNNLPVQDKQQFYQAFISKDGIIPMLNADTQQKVAQHIPNYQKAQDTINRMAELGIIMSGPPIKKQMLSEKKKIVKNFQQLTEIYNNWAKQNPEIATEINDCDLSDNMAQEANYWNTIIAATDLQLEQPPNQL